MITHFNRFPHLNFPGWTCLPDIVFYLWLHRFVSLLHPSLSVEEHWPPHPPAATPRQWHNASVDKTVSTHKQVTLCCRAIYFLQAFFILAKEIRPRDIYWQFGFFWHCPNWACYGGNWKKESWEKVGGDMLLLLVTMGEPTIAGCYLRVWPRRRYRLATTPGHRTPTTYQATWR